MDRRRGAGARVVADVDLVARADRQVRAGIDGARARAIDADRPTGGQLHRAGGGDAAAGGVQKDTRLRRVGRSEEHTSELQSLMRISYAVFCLKTKKHMDTH